MKNNNTSGGIGFVGTLTIVFIVLKLIGVIEWDWVWVLSPIWISLCFALGYLFIIGLSIIVYAALKGRLK